MIRIFLLSLLSFGSLAYAALPDCAQILSPRVKNGAIVKLDIGDGRQFDQMAYLGRGVGQHGTTHVVFVDLQMRAQNGDFGVFAPEPGDVRFPKGIDPDKDPILFVALPEPYVNEPTPAATWGLFNSLRTLALRGHKSSLAQKTLDDGAAPTVVAEIRDAMMDKKVESAADHLRAVDRFLIKNGIQSVQINDWVDLVTALKTNRVVYLTYFGLDNQMTASQALSLVGLKTEKPELATFETFSDGSTQIDLTDLRSLILHHEAMDAPAAGFVFQEN